MFAVVLSPMSTKAGSRGVCFLIGLAEEWVRLPSRTEVVKSEGNVSFIV